MKKEELIKSLPNQFTPYYELDQNPLDFYSSTGRFDLSLFDVELTREKLQRMKYYQKKELENLEKIKKEYQPNPSLLSLPVSTHIENMNNAFTGTVKDLENKKFNFETLTKDNRLFYLGLILILIYIFYLIISSL